MSIRRNNGFFDAFSPYAPLIFTAYKTQLLFIMLKIFSDVEVSEYFLTYVRMYITIPLLFAVPAVRSV